MAWGDIVHPGGKDCRLLLHVSETTRQLLACFSGTRKQWADLMQKWFSRPQGPPQWPTSCSGTPPPEVPQLPKEPWERPWCRNCFLNWRVPLGTVMYLLGPVESLVALVSPQNSHFQPEQSCSAICLKRLLLDTILSISGYTKLSVVTEIVSEHSVNNFCELTFVLLWLRSSFSFFFFKLSSFFAFLNKKEKWTTLYCVCKR